MALRAFTLRNRCMMALENEWQTELQALKTKPKHSSHSTILRQAEKVCWSWYINSSHLPYYNNNFTWKNGPSLH